MGNSDQKSKSGFFRKLFRKPSEKRRTSPKSLSFSSDWNSSTTYAPAANQHKHETATSTTAANVKSALPSTPLLPSQEHPKWVMHDHEDKAYDEHSEGEPDLHDLMSDDDADVFSQRTGEIYGGMQIAENAADYDADTLLANLSERDLSFPKYIKATRKNNKSPRVLNNLFLAQELRTTPLAVGGGGSGGGGGGNGSSSSNSSIDENSNAFPDSSSLHEDEVPMNPNEILVMQFSRDGKYLAVAGRDSRITVWQVLSSPLSRLKYKSLEIAAANGGNAKKSGSKSKVFNGAPVFLQEPVRVFEGHTKSVLCLDWSKNNFLLSGSMDKTVRLWNVDRDECLDTFHHGDFVTALRFHPNDDRFFISGALDNQLRLWSILERSVAYTNDLGDNALITALEFTPWGNYCMVGGFNGSLFALETQGLHLVKRIELRKNGKVYSSHSAHGNTISGIRIFENPTCADVPITELEKWNVLITTNDSTVRLVDLSLRKLVTRFRGNSNQSTAIVASLSEDNRYIISGSEDHWCYVWDNNNSIINHKLRSSMKEILLESKNQLDEKHKRISKLFHDNRLWRKLPIQMFLEDENGKKYIANDNTSYSSFHAHSSRVNVALFAPEKSKRLLQFADDKIFDLVKRGTILAESKGLNLSSEKTWGSDHIIVTCDVSGLIRVFRQDPAFYIRKNLLELKKVQKRGRSRNNHSSERTDSFDLTSRSEHLFTVRSKSPTSQDCAPLNIRNKLQSKILPPFTRTSSLSSVRNDTRAARSNSDLSRHA